MNRLLAVLLGASLAMNGWLAWNWASTRAELASPLAQARSTTVFPVPALGPSLRAVRSVALPDLVTALRNEGLSREMLRSILWGCLKDKYAAELQASEPVRRDDSVWWRSPKPDPAAELRSRQRGALLQKMESELAQLLGESPPGPPRDGRYAFLSDEKTAALRRLERDYSEIRTKAHAVGGGLGRERVKLVDDEWRRDLAALLSPDELREYDVRFAAGADMLRVRLAAIDGTEAEYRALLALEGRVRAESTGSSRQALQQEAARLLGRERAADYFWQNEPGYREVSALVAKIGRPELRADYIDVRNKMTERAAAVAQDPQLSTEAKFTSLAHLAIESRRELTRLLPANTVAELDAAMGWIVDLEQGIARVYYPEASGHGSIALPRETRKGSRGP